jgi:hypothetical protein
MIVKTLKWTGNPRWFPEKGAHMKKSIYFAIVFTLLLVSSSCASIPSGPPSVIYPDPMEDPGNYNAPGQ